MSKLTDITFPAILKAERTRLGWTRRKMSEVTDIPAATIRTWENGKEPVGYVKRYVLAELREYGRSVKNYAKMADLLSECDEYLESYSGVNYIGTGSRLHQDIKAVLKND